MQLEEPDPFLCWSRQWRTLSAPFFCELKETDQEQEV